jgi:AP-1-like transcription factor
MWSLTIIFIQDESRLMKRKEQNRAAQRAFRERKEKHVKDVSFNL